MKRILLFVSLALPAAATANPSFTIGSNPYETVFASPSGYEGDPESVRSWMRVSSHAYKRGYALGGLTTTAGQADHAFKWQVQEPTSVRLVIVYALAGR